MNEPEGLDYPDSKRHDQIDVYHGVEVADPYRWLEEPDSEDARAWIEAQNRLTFGYLGSIPEREKIRERLTSLWNHERYGVPWRKGNHIFFTRNDGLQNQDVLYRLGSFEGEAGVLLDPNLLSPDGTVSVQQYEISDEGDYLAYGVSTSGSDWIEIRIREVRTGRDLTEKVRWVKFSTLSWDRSTRGFFYSRYDEPEAAKERDAANYYQKLYYHRLGTDPSDDILIYERPDEKEWGFGGSVTEDGNYLILHVWKGTERQNLIFYKELLSPGRPVVELIDLFDAEYEVIGNDGPIFWLKTDSLAPRGRVLAIDTRRPGRENWVELIAEREETLVAVTVVGNRFIAQYLKDAQSQVRVHALDGSPLGEIPLPGIGTVSGFTGRRDDTETFYSFTSFTVPGTIFRFDVGALRSRLFREPTTTFDAESYETKQIFFESKDGTQIPMFLTCRKGMKCDPTTPTFLYGYGGFNISVTPAFSAAALSWIEMGGLYAVANLRGGGEYGERWHRAGTRLKKQNVFDDFISAAEWLISNRYTSTSKLAIGGRSNGGLLIGAAITQRPDLFGAALPAVGVMDMLRFDQFTIGWAWVSDYGSPDDPEEFLALYAYSPLHNLRPHTAYPPTMITTADHDDRVVPAHSFKFAAALQAAQGGEAPVLIRIETKAGHGIGTPTTKLIEEAADRWAFLVRALDIDPFGA